MFVDIFIFLVLSVFPVTSLVYVMLASQGGSVMLVSGTVKITHVNRESVWTKIEATSVIARMDLQVHICRSFWLQLTYEAGEKYEVMNLAGFRLLLFQNYLDNF